MMDAFSAIIASSLILVSIFYSAPPLRFKEHPPLDSLSNGLIIFLISALGFSFISKPILPDFAVLSIGVASVHAFSTIMDYSPDKNAGIRTLSTVFTKRGAAVFALFLMLISFSMLKIWEFFIITFMFASIAIYSVMLFSNDERLARKLFLSQFLIALICCAGFILTY